MGGITGYIKYIWIFVYIMIGLTVFLSIRAILKLFGVLPKKKGDDKLTAKELEAKGRVDETYVHDADIPKDDAHYNHLADRLQAAMEGYTWGWELFGGLNVDGTDLPALEAILLPLNNAELMKVYVAFNIRPYYWESIDLYGWFDAETSGTEQQRLRNIFSATSKPYL